MGKEVFFSAKISKKQASDTGMAIVLIFLLIGLFTSKIIFYKIAIPVLVINMTVPMVFYFFAIIWLGFSRLLGLLISNVLLTVIYLIMVLPVGFFRKMIGKDTLMLHDFKKERKSVLKVRDVLFKPADFEKPF